MRRQFLIYSRSGVQARNRRRPPLHGISGAPWRKEDLAIKYLAPLLLLAIASIACDGGGLDERAGRFAAYESGYEAGYEDGFDDGYEAGQDPCRYWQEQRQAAQRSRESLEELIARAELPPVIAGLLVEEATARLDEAGRAVDEHC